MQLSESWSGIDGALERFQEAAAAVRKWRIVGKEERRLEKALTKAFRQQGRAFLRGFAALRLLFEGATWHEMQRVKDALRHIPFETLREEWTADDWLEVFDDAAGETFTQFLRPIERGVQTALLAGANNLIGRIGVDASFSLRNPRAVAYVDAHGASLVSGINDTTRDYIRTLMRQAADEGWSYSRTAQALTDRYSEFAVGVPQQHIQSRAQLIAVTEIGNAYEAGNEIVVQDLQDAGLRMEKKWLTVGDDRVSEGCQENADEGWIPYESPHASGDMHPLRFPGCRCTELYRRAPS